GIGLCDRGREAAPPAPPPAASARPVWRGRGSWPDRQNQEKADQRDEDEAEIVPNTEILQAVKPTGDIVDGFAGRRIERVPDGVPELHDEPGRSRIERRRHLDRLARTKHKRAEHAADRLGEARGAVLR